MEPPTKKKFKKKFFFFFFFGRIHFRNFSMKKKMKEIYVFVYEYTFYFEDKKNIPPRSPCYMYLNCMRTVRGYMRIFYYNFRNFT